MNDNREIFEVPGVYEKPIIFCGQLNLDSWTLDKLLFTNLIYLASTINFWICRISRLFVFFFSKYIFVSFQTVIQLALVTFVIDDWLSKVTSISRTFNIITMLVRVYSGTNLLWYELTIKPMNQLIDPENDWTEVSYLFYKEMPAKPSIMLIWKIYI
jgi:hypothetical protein